MLCFVCESQVGEEAEEDMIAGDEASVMDNRDGGMANYEDFLDDDELAAWRANEQESTADDKNAFGEETEEGGGEWKDDGVPQGTSLSAVASGKQRKMAGWFANGPGGCTGALGLGRRWYAKNAVQR